MTAPHVGTPRRADLSYAEWLLLTPEFAHRHPAEVQAQLHRLDTVRRDLAARRGARDRDVVPADLCDVEHVLDEARTHAELLARDRLTVVREWCWSWHSYLEFLAATDRRASTPTGSECLRSALAGHAARTRDPFLAGGAQAERITPLAELRGLRRTTLVQDAEDVLRGRADGSPELRSQLVRLGYLTANRARGPHRRQWDSAQDDESARARRRLLVAEVVRALVRDSSAAGTLALATCAHPTDVARGTRQLERLVSDGRLSTLVAAGILPATAPWRIGRPLQPAVHVALTRLDDEDLLVSVPDQPAGAERVRVG